MGLQRGRQSDGAEQDRGGTRTGARHARRFDHNAGTCGRSTFATIRFGSNNANGLKSRSGSGTHASAIQTSAFERTAGIPDQRRSQWRGTFARTSGRRIDHATICSGACTRNACSAEGGIQ
jgi:hypothetical protein